MGGLQKFVQHSFTSRRVPHGLWEIGDRNKCEGKRKKKSLGAFMETIIIVWTRKVHFFFCRFSKPLR